MTSAVRGGGGLRRLLAVASVAAAGLALIAGASGSGDRLERPSAALVFGRGLGPWRLNMPYRRAPGLIRSRVQHNLVVEDEDDPCAIQTMREDEYDGLELNWKRTAAGFRLWSIVARRPRDRSADGFVIGTATQREVQRRHPQGVTEFRNPEALGRWELVLYGRNRTYGQFWFNAHHRLVALTTGHYGC